MTAIHDFTPEGGAAAFSERADGGAELERNAIETHVAMGRR